MQDLTAQLELQIERLQTLVPDGEEFRSFLAQTLDEQISSISEDTPMGIVPPSILSRTKMLASARIAVELIEKPNQLAAKPEGIVDLGIIEWLLRPSLPLVDGRFEQINSGPWKDLASDFVASESSAVCRLDVSINGSTPIHIGTGFVAGEDADGRFIILTNAHVVEEVLRIGWPNANSVVFGCDFERYAVDVGGELYSLDEHYEIHPVYDLALLYLPHESVPVAEMVNPLTMAAQAPKQTIDLKIGVIGHPSFDSRLDPFPIFFGFGNEFGVKRFSPGLIRSLEERVWRGSEVRMFLHDATTLSGSSGSCIVDLNTLKIVGLHFGGWPLRQRTFSTTSRNLIAQLFESNGAVPLWELRDAKFLSRCSFN